MIPRNEYGYPTCRCYPRSLSQAFPEVRAQWLEGPDRTHTAGDTAVAIVLWAGAAVIALVLASEYVQLGVV